MLTGQHGTLKTRIARQVFVIAAKRQNTKLTLAHLASVTGVTVGTVRRDLNLTYLPAKRYSWAAINRHQFSTARSQARRRHLHFELTRDDYRRILSGICVYGGKGDADGVHTTLERKDNSIGYTASNCVAACWRHNIRRSNDFTFEEFLDAVKRYPGLAVCGNIGPRKRKYARA